MIPNCLSLVFCITDTNLCNYFIGDIIAATYPIKSWALNYSYYLNNRMEMTGDKQDSYPDQVLALCCSSGVMVCWSKITGPVSV